MRFKFVYIALIFFAFTLLALAQYPTSVTQIGQFTAPSLQFQAYFGQAAISSP